MADCSAVLKRLLFLMFFLHLSSAGSHSLQYLYTRVTSGGNFPEFTAVVLVDGVQFMYYDSNNRRIKEEEWIQKFKADNPQYWEKENERVEIQQDMLNNILTHTKGCVQRMFGCELYDNGTTRRFDQFGYNGEDFISLDLRTGSWTAANDEAEIFIKQWKAAGDQAKKSKEFLETKCVHWLKKLVSYNETLERKVPEASLFQKHSPSPEVVCHATGFFPKAVNISWQKDGEDVYEDVELNATLPNQDGSFQKRSILKVPAEELQKHNYTCVIQHNSLEKDLVLPVSERRILDKQQDGGSGGGSGGGSSGETIGVIVAVVAVVAAVGLVTFVIQKKKRNPGEGKKLKVQEKKTYRLPQEMTFRIE